MTDQFADEIRKKAEEADKAPVHIALFGQPGAGKSSLINAIVGRTLARVGVENDVTTERGDYEWNGLFLSDLPGYGTAKFPSASYFEKFEISKFDIFLCITAGKLKDDDTSFFRRLGDEGKRRIIVRNKIDSEFEPGATDAEIRSKITENICKQLDGNFRVIFTSCKTKEGLDDLQEAIKHHLSGAKRDRFLRTAAAYSKKFLDEKRDTCTKFAWYAAGTSAVGSMVPVPGLGIAADLVVLLSAMIKIRMDFNLDEARMDRFAVLLPSVAPRIRGVIASASTEGILLALKRVAPAVATSEVAKYVPLLGTVVAGLTSGGLSFWLLKKYIDDCYEIAEEVLKAHIEF